MIESGKILIVEDDEFKLNNLKAIIEKLSPNSEIDVNVAVAEAAINLSKNQYDLIILDMSLPAREIKAGTGPTESMLSGGLEILLELDFENRTEDVIIVTQYPEIEIDGNLVATHDAVGLLRDKYFSGVLACIVYEHSEEIWKHQLTEALVDK